MYYWWRGLRLNTHEVWNIKSVYWFNDQVRLHPLSLPSLSFSFHHSPIFTFQRKTLFLFPPLAFLQALKYHFFKVFFSMMLCVHSKKAKKEAGENEELTNQVTKSFDKGKLRANDRINIFWIDEHEASTWHLTQTGSGRLRRSGGTREKLSNKINSAICNKKSEYNVPTFDFLCARLRLNSFACLTSTCFSFQCFYVNHSANA